nr:hypothetical protein [Tanacetum cinerariifolium]
MLFPVWSAGFTNPQNNAEDAAFDGKEHDFDVKKPDLPYGKSPFINASHLPDDLDMPKLKDITYSDDEDVVGAEADSNNLESSIPVSPILTTRIHKDHPVSQIISDLSSTTQTRSMTRAVKDQALKDPSWIEAMQEELLQFKMQKVWVLVDLPYGKRTIGTKWVYKNEKDERGIVIKNKERLVAQGHAQEEGIDFEEFFALVARIEGDIIFGATNKDLCKSFEKLMKDKFQMSSMGELTFFLGLQVKQKKDEIFISQDKYVAKILRMFGLKEGKSARIPIDTEKPLLKDPDGEDVDVHTYMLMTGSLMYLTSSRPDIMFAVCACAHFQVTPKASHLHAVKRIFRYLKGKPHLGLWYPKYPPFDLVAYSDSDYAGASLDRKSTTEGCQFLGCRLISWQCKKQTVVATSSIEAEYVAATKATIREALRLDDAEGVDCLPNEEIFAELARMGYEMPSTKLTFYKAFFSSQWKFLIYTILQCMSAKKTSWNEFSSSMALAIICLSSGNEKGDADDNVEEVNAGDVAEGDDSATHGEVPTVQQTPPQSPQKSRAFEFDKVAQALEITKLKRRVKKLEKRNKERMIAEIDQDDAVFLDDDKEEDREVADAVKDVEEAKEDKTEPAEVQEVVDVVTTAKLIIEVVTAASETVTAASVIITTDEAQVPAATLTAAPVRVAVAPSRRRKGVVIRDPEEESNTSTIIPAETKSKDKGKGILVEEPKPLKKKQQIEHDEQYTRELHAELNKDIDWDEDIDHVKRKAKEDPAVKKYHAVKRKLQTEAQARKNMMMYVKNVAGFKMDYFKGMSYDDIRPIFEAKFNSNVAFLLKKKEQIEKDENKALQKLNETPAERATKRKKLDEEVEELRRYLQIVPNKDYDVYTEAIPLARKVPVVDYQVIEMNNKPYYKIIRADDIHQLYLSFLSLLRNFDREDLEDLWSLVKERFYTTKPKNFFDDFLLVTLGAMFEKPNIHYQIWKTQRNEHGPAKLILLVERKYPLTRFTLDQMLNAVRLEVEEESEVSLELLRFTRQQHQEGYIDAAKKKLRLLNVKCCCWNKNGEITKYLMLLE